MNSSDDLYDIFRILEEDLNQNNMNNLETIIYSELKTPVSHENESQNLSRGANKKTTLEEKSNSKEKTNLNKMTLIQPFDETKILINLNSVSSEMLNNLVRKDRFNNIYYCIPPARAYGFFKKK